MGSAVVAGLVGTAAALAGSLCCVGPLLFVAFGVGAGFATAFEPLRPLFGVLMLAAFAVGFYTVYGRSTRQAACAPGEACAVPRSRTRDKVTLWTAAILAIALWTFPSWSVWLI